MAGASLLGHHVFVCGACETLGLGVAADQTVPRMLPLDDVGCISARAEASCCVALAPLQSSVTTEAADDMERGTSSASSRQPLKRDSWVYLWGDVRCCLRSDSFAFPTPVFRIPSPVKAVRLGGFFGLALTHTGEVRAWGDGTYGELGGAVNPGAGSDASDEEDLLVPGIVVVPADMDDASSTRILERSHTAPLKEQSLPNSARGTPSDSLRQMGRGHKRIVDIACGERHSLLLREDGRLFAFGENLAGQCGVPEAVGAGHLTGKSVQRARLVPVDGPRKG